MQSTMGFLERQIEWLQLDVVGRQIDGSGAFRTNLCHRLTLLLMTMQILNILHLKAPPGTRDRQSAVGPNGWRLLLWRLERVCKLELPNS